VVTRRSGRETLHVLNPVPVRLVHDRWTDKDTERQASALAGDVEREGAGGARSGVRSDLKTLLETGTSLRG
jgi:hypothetical protein